MQQIIESQIFTYEQVLELVEAVATRWRDNVLLETNQEATTQNVISR